MVVKSPPPPYAEGSPQHSGRRGGHGSEGTAATAAGQAGARGSGPAASAAAAAAGAPARRDHGGRPGDVPAGAGGRDPRPAGAGEVRAAGHGAPAAGGSLLQRLWARLGAAVPAGGQLPADAAHLTGGRGPAGAAG